MGVVAAEQRRDTRPRVAKGKERRPAVPEFLAEHAETVELVPRNLARVVGILRQSVHQHQALQRPASPLLRGVEQLDVEALDIVGDGQLVGEGAVLSATGVGEHHHVVELIREDAGRTSDSVEHGVQLERVVNCSPIA